MSYSFSREGNTIACLLEPSRESIFESGTLRDGLRVNDSLPFSDLVQDRGEGLGRYNYHGYRAYRELYLHWATGKSRIFRLASEVPAKYAQPYLSADGKMVVVAEKVTELPEEWKEYAYVKDAVAHQALDDKDLARIVLIDSRTGREGTLVDAPLGSSQFSAIWTDDSKNIVVAGLPLSTSSSQDLKRSQTNSFVVEVAISAKQLSMVVEYELDMQLLRWDARAGELEIGRHIGESKFRYEYGSSLPRPQLSFFRKIGWSWRQVEHRLREEWPNIELDQDMNTPPRIVAVDSASKRRVVLLDLNPQFKTLALAKVQEVRWEGLGGGREWRGGLYYPPGYQAGMKYPLVIQTHGWRPDEFSLSGYANSGYAAQALAAHGIFVLQVDDASSSDFENRFRYEGAIKHLEGLGLIDRNRVGIMGWSGLNMRVKETLVTSRFPFAAAMVEDGEDMGYFQYLTSSDDASDDAALIGGVPWDGHWDRWLERVPGFNVDKVHTPLRIIAPNTDALIGEWEWFAALSILHKPVELIFMQDDEHVLVKPRHRLTSQQGNVDWFVFWLKGEEDPDPAKRPQYAQWRKLRNLQEQSGTTP